MFQAPRSSVDIAFWEKLQRLKLDEFKLSSEFVNISGYLCPASGLRSGSVSVDGSSFDSRSGLSTSVSQEQRYSSLLQYRRWFSLNWLTLFIYVCLIVFYTHLYTSGLNYAGSSEISIRLRFLTDLADTIIIWFHWNFICLGISLSS